MRATLSGCKHLHSYHLLSFLSALVRVQIALGQVLQASIPSR